MIRRTKIRSIFAKARDLQYGWYRASVCKFSGTYLVVYFFIHCSHGVANFICIGKVEKEIWVGEYVISYREKRFLTPEALLPL